MFIIHCITSWALFTRWVVGQQFSAGRAPVNYPGLSSGCLQAMNGSIVDCPSFLVAVSQSDDHLSTEQLGYLCKTNCLTTLQSARTKISSACKGSNDVIVFGGVAYPATFLADHFIYTYNLGCRKDKASGAFCDALGSNSTATAKPCSDCSIGQLQAQLGSPLGYDKELEADFAKLTSSCKASGYTFSATTTYAINGSATVQPENTAAPSTTSAPCFGKYTRLANDTCESIASANNVSSFALRYVNGIDTACSNLPAVGKSVCLPQTCKLHRWRSWEDCLDVSVLNNITDSQLHAWNGNINTLCENVNALNGTYVCVSPPGGSIDIPDAPVSSSAGNGGGVPTASATGAQSAAPTPTNMADGSNAKCGTWHNVVKDDSCFDLAKANSLGLDDFFFLNKGLKTDCSNLLLNASYCVQAVGDIKTYPGYGGTSTTQAPAWSTNSVSNCGTYYTVNAGDTCGKNIQPSFSIDPTKFSSLNHVDCTAIQAGVAYCVATKTASSRTTSSKTASQTPATTDAPAWSTNVVAGCSTYYTVRAGDTCGNNIEPKFSINPSQFSSINKVDCARIQGGVAYCVATKTAG